jgi:NADPH:quinone reductase-like Zn-dependent oxidoreductase
MAMADRRILWKVVGSLSGAAAGAATRALLRAGWRRTKGGDPPTNPASPSTRWSEALIWAAASGVAMAVTRLVAQRGAAEAWRAGAGEYPPGLETVSP